VKCLFECYEFKPGPNLLLLLTGRRLYSRLGNPGVKQGHELNIKVCRHTPCGLKK